MKNKSLRIIAFLLFLMLLHPQLLLAYVGPGTGMSAIGTFFAFIFGIFAAILGFIWYPVKRLLKRKSKEPDQVNDIEE
jgi:membrane protein implicated in regulation of membrane protease activity